MQYEIVTSRVGIAIDLDRNERWTKGVDEGLEEKVNKLIGEGWKPLGGVSMVVMRHNDQTTDFNSVMFSQAMIKE